MIFDKDFFIEEEKEGFLIPSLMKRAWAAEMELLQVVIDICNRHNIRDFADGGTLLGAVRHHGFIPWDDDIDIALTRPEYNRLVSYLRTELPPGFAMAGMYADTEALQTAAFLPYIRVVIDGSHWKFSDILQRFHAFPFYCIGMDIFPLDYMPKDPALTNLQQILIQQIYLLMVNANSENDFSEEQLQKIEQIEGACGVTLPRDHTLKNSLWKLADSISSLYNDEDADYVTDYAYWVKTPQLIFKKEWFDECIMLPFENMVLPAPKGYHEVLTTYYGDYRIPVKGAADHSYPFYAAQERIMSEIFRQRGMTQSIAEFCDHCAEIYHCDS